MSTCLNVHVFKQKWGNLAGFWHIGVIWWELTDS